jgi:hypothetical protein
MHVTLCVFLGCYSVASWFCLISVLGWCCMCCILRGTTQSTTLGSRRTHLAAISTSSCKVVNSCGKFYTYHLAVFVIPFHTNGEQNVVQRRVLQMSHISIARFPHRRFVHSFPQLQPSLYPMS